VWLSAAWSRAALGSFRAALTAAVEGAAAATSSQARADMFGAPGGAGGSAAQEDGRSGGPQPVPPAVLVLLRHWLVNDEVPLAAARAGWLGSADAGGMSGATEVANFKDKVGLIL
jgi:hypothetical protein